MAMEICLLDSTMKQIDIYFFCATTLSLDEPYGSLGPLVHLFELMV